jgi:hypothetical protein
MSAINLQHPQLFNSYDPTVEADGNEILQSISHILQPVTSNQQPVTSNQQPFL